MRTAENGSIVNILEVSPVPARRQRPRARAAASPVAVRRQWPDWLRLLQQWRQELQQGWRHRCGGRQRLPARLACCECRPASPSPVGDAQVEIRKLEPTDELTQWLPCHPNIRTRRDGQHQLPRFSVYESTALTLATRWTDSPESALAGCRAWTHPDEAHQQLESR